MGLRKYHSKRRFDRTTEPRGKVGVTKTSKSKAKGLQYVVQKHAATRLHYDFRLEHGGVLKSWAVPKGPSLVPGDKRLAVEVEDHPLEYGSFEGTIPEGEYGAGEVIIWDRGTWQPSGSVDDGLKKGKLKFELFGEKLHGNWALVRMRDSADKPQWLLRKERDDAAQKKSATPIIEERPESLVSGRKIGPRVPKAKRPLKIHKPKKALAANSVSQTQTVLEDLPSEKLPAFIQPQLATRVAAPPPGSEWLYEMKFDGYRILARIEDEECSLISRNQKSWTERYDSIAEALSPIKADQVLLDGELVVFLPDGRTDFQSLQNKTAAYSYCVFDILHLNGHSLRELPLIKRKEIARNLLQVSHLSQAIQFSEHLIGNGPELYTNACKRKLEGLIAKKADAPYEPKRSRSWLKIKCEDRQEFVIGGFNRLRNEEDLVGALHLGYFSDDGRLIYSGKVGTGFDTKTREKLFGALWKKRQDDNPFDGRIAGAKGAIWTKPELVAEAAFTEWTGDGRLRHPRFLGVRDDKVASSVKRERPLPLKEIESGASEATKEMKGKKVKSKGESKANVLHGVTFTHPERELFSKPAVTKLELAEYYSSAADIILPELQKRLLTLVRCPEGAGTECFFQKHGGISTPKKLPRLQVVEKDKEDSYLYVKDISHVMMLVQMSCLELHTWGSRIPKIEAPDRLILDLDPGPGILPEALIEGVYKARALCEEIGLETFVKTTGGKGYHLVAAIKPLYSWETIRILAEGIARTLVSRNKSLFVAVSTKSKRQGKIYCDYLRNGRGATAIANYSTRAKPGAPIAVPLTWKEFSLKIKPDTFNIKNIAERLKKNPDPWGDISKKAQKFPTALLKTLK